MKIYSLRNLCLAVFASVLFNMDLSAQVVPGPNNPPAFVNGTSTNITVCNGANFSLDTLLAVTDGNTGQTITWTVFTSPTHGTLAGFLAKFPTNGGTVYPPGTSYSNTSGSSDLFVIEASDGFATVQITVNVTVFPAAAVSCPGNVTVSNDAGQCGAVVNYPAATGTGIITYSQNSGTFFPVGITIVKSTSKTGCDTVSCTFSVTVNDTTKPVINCPGPVSVNNTTGICGAYVTYALPTVSDNCCTPPTTVAGLDYLGTYNGHTYFKNNNGLTWNDASATALTAGGRLVTIADAAENAFLQPLLSSDGWIGGVQNHNNPAYAEPGGGWEWIDGTAFSYTNWSAFEPNQAGPEDNIEIYTGGTWNDLPNSSLLPSYVEFACARLNLTAGLASGGLFPVGTTTVTYQATDSSGNSSTCSFNVTVTDNELPSFEVIDTAHLSVTISVPGFGDETGFNLKDNDGNFLLNAGGFGYGSTNSFGPVTSINGPYTLNVSTVGAFEDNTANYTVYCNGSVATSGSVGQNSTASVPVTCGSRTSTCPADVLVNAPTGQCGTTASWTPPTAIDNCSVSSVTSNHNPGDFFTSGTTQVIYVATDASGNKDTCKFNVIVNGSPVDDGNPCTTDGCDPVTGVYHNPTSNTITVGPISGTYKTSCIQLANYNGLPYSIPAVSGATYQWSVPAGMVIVTGQNTNAISVNMSLTAVHNGIVGQMCVIVKHNCDSGGTCITIEIEGIKPVAPGSIFGPGKLCPGDVATFSIVSVSRATYYQWNLPGNMSGNSTGTSITVTALAGFNGGTLGVMAGNICGTGPARTKAIILNPPGTPSAITGPMDGVCGMTGVGYSVTGVSGIAYHWTATSGASIASGQNSPSVMVDYPSNFVTSTLSMTGTNGCGTSPARTLTVRGKPALPGTISGTTTVCTGVPAHYAVATDPGTNTYNWTGPVGISISGQGSKEVDITFSIAGSGRTIGVIAGNSCGTSAKRSLGGITVNNCPRVGDDVSESSLSVYPNPAHDQLTVSFTTDKTAEIVMTLNDVIGRTVSTEKKTAAEGLNTYEMDLTKISKGLYLLQVEMGDRKETIKLVVE